ncbi:uncharacterized protein EDB93DRAFT_1272068 [Suillus bovinus]|uniref:uncharacterized protein n=1 Tax=Suillus bovinus TaxID=48563 RepID=UPI001B85BA68|nr:uncharacterized protein EDB93DRAFT_1272068 [Suillus bovinus]KAG2153018.1 hypothetical protein EDB93DRAFT_1272068 [Suillus bovinus]
MDFDLVVRNGTIVTASDIWESCDIGVKDGTIIAVGPRLPAAPSAQEIDAEGTLEESMLSVGIDHSIVTNGVVPDPENFVGDTFNTGTRSAKDESIIAVIEDYHKLAKDQSYCDYAFHVIISNPTPQIIEDEFPWMDYQILDVMYSARKLGITTMVHAENADVIDWMTQHLEQKLMTHPYHHGASRPLIVEAEATNRVICLAELMDTPILLVHISGGLATKHIRDAQMRLLPIYGETCPQYMFLLADSMRKGDFEGAKCICSPLIREDKSDQDAIWAGVKNGSFTIVSSDHAPSKFNHPSGKQRGLKDGNLPYGKFHLIPNGLPGVEIVLYDSNNNNFITTRSIRIVSPSE